MKTKYSLKHIMAVLLIIAMVFGFFPTVVSAAEGDFKINITTNAAFSDTTSATQPYLQFRYNQNTNSTNPANGCTTVLYSDVSSTTFNGTKFFYIYIPNYYTQPETLHKIIVNGTEIIISDIITDTTTPFYYYDVTDMGSIEAILTPSFGLRMKLLDVTATSDINVEYVFGEAYVPAFTPTVVLGDGEDAKGSIVNLEAKRDITDEQDNIIASEWKLTTAPANGYMLDYIQKGEDTGSRIYSQDGTTVTWDETDDGAAYAAYFKTVQIVLRDSFKISPWSRAESPDSIKSDGTVWINNYNLNSTDVYEGQRAVLQINYTLLGQVAGGTSVSFAIYAGETAEGTPLASYEGQFYGDGSEMISAGNKTVSFILNQMPVINKATVVANLNNQETPMTKTYDVTVKPSAELSLTYLTKDYGGIAAPWGLYDGATIEVGPNFNDVLAFTDETTGKLTIYAAGMLGVFKSDGNNFTLMNGMTLGVYDNLQGSEYVYAIGGASGDDLTALVKTSSAIPGHQDGYRLYRYTAESGQWTEVANSFVSQINWLDNIKALVIGHDNVWINDTHWDGTGWQANELSFTNFYKAGTNYYANAASGAYKYNTDTGAWETVSIAGLEGTLQIQKVNYGGTLLVNAGGTIYLVKNGEAPVAVPTTNTLVQNPSDDMFDVGLDSDGNVYAAVLGRDYAMGSFSARGTYIFKLVNGAWQYQVTDAFLGPQDSYDEMNNKYRPEMVRSFYSAADNVTVLAGIGGTTYLLDKQTTITFETGPLASGVEPITQNINSAVTAPEPPTKLFMNFAGWYTDEACTDGNRYDFSVMPAKDITLYAKWSDSYDPAYDRTQALGELDTAFAGYDRSNYLTEEWTALTGFYNGGKTEINAAETKADITAALNAAKAGMAGVTASMTGKMTVCVSMEKFTLDAGYIIEPKLVVVDKSMQASVAITDALKAQYPSLEQPWTMTGSVTNNFYLASVYDPNYTNGQVLNYLGEFDEGQWSGWMYCVNNVFPGVGASAWRLSNGDVMRWQYTCEGLGADIGAGNFANEDIAVVANKDALTWKIAEINGMIDNDANFLSTIPSLTDAYNNAMTALSTRLSTQETVDNALAALNALIQSEEVNHAPNIKGELGTGKTAYYNAGGTYSIDLSGVFEDKDSDALTYQVKINDGEYTDTEAVYSYTTEDELTRLKFRAYDGSQYSDEYAVTLMKAAELPGLNETYKSTGALVMAYTPNPLVASVGGEWAVIGLARSGYPAPESLYANYYANVVKELKDTGGILSTTKFTEYSRVILGLTSIGKDVTDVGGYNLLTYLTDLDKVKIQGINGPIWALIALDSGDYEIPATDAANPVTREKLITEILTAELDGGGWALDGTAADPDMTGMAIQSLAPYYGTDQRITAAVDRALAKLSEMQNDSGGFYSWASQNSESCAQAIVALTSLGIDPATDPRFVKDSHSLIDALLEFYVSGGGFRHTVSGELDGMATEQAYYALASYYRLKEGKTSLYDMTDVTIQASYATVISLIDAISNPVTLEDGTKITAARAAYDALDTDKKALVTNYAKLTAAEAEYQKLKDEADRNKDNSSVSSGSRSVTVSLGGVEYTLDEPTANVFNTVTALSEKITARGGPATLNDIYDVFAAYKAYENLTEEQKIFITNYPQLEAAMNAIAEEIQTDKTTGLNVSGVPWYAGVKVEPVDENSGVWDKLEGDEDNDRLLLAYEVSLFDYANNSDFTADGEVTVTMKVPDYAGYDGIMIVHQKSNGSIEYIKPTFNGDGTMSFVLKSFSPVGVLAYTGASPLDLKATEEANNLLWILVIAGAVVVIGGAIVIRMRNKSKKEE